MAGNSILNFLKKANRELKGDSILQLGGIDMRVLDFDMDYFMSEIANTPFSCKERLAEEDYGNSV